MRSKEVEKAIKLLKTYENKLVYEIGNKDKIAVEIVLNYISELEDELTKEKQLNVKYLKIRDKEYIKKQMIRDKIKELEEKYVELSKNKSSSEKAELNHEYIEKRSLLESLLGE